MGVNLWDPLSARGLSYAGTGYVAGHAPDGLVTINSAPGARRLLIFQRASCQICGETWSAADGTYQLSGFDPGQQFDIIGRDYTGTYNDVIVSRVRPRPY